MHESNEMVMCHAGMSDKADDETAPHSIAVSLGIWPVLYLGHWLYYDLFSVIV